MCTNWQQAKERLDRGVCRLTDASTLGVVCYRDGLNLCWRVTLIKQPEGAGATNSVGGARSGMRAIVGQVRGQDRRRELSRHATAACLRVCL
jgi:hypothetical protein